MPHVLRSRARPAEGGDETTGCRRRLLIAVSLPVLAVLAGPGAAAAAVQVGVYQDDPVTQLAPLIRAAGAPRVLSTYVTGGQLVDRDVVALAKRRRMRLLIGWMPDSGATGGRPTARTGLKGVNRGAYDASLRALARQVRGLRPAPILRPMPEMNTTWYHWSGARTGNSAAAYRRAWNRVHRVVRGAAGNRVKLMWAPYARSVPDTPANAYAAYFPGVAKVDLVGTSAYNFGDRGGLAWTDPRSLFADVYRETQALAPTRPFWIAETGSTGLGGAKAGWIAELATLPSAFPALQGLVWYDVKEPNGDFRLRGVPASARAFRAFMKAVR